MRAAVSLKVSCGVVRTVFEKFKVKLQGQTFDLIISGSVRDIAIIFCGLVGVVVVFQSSWNEGHAFQGHRMGRGQNLTPIFKCLPQIFALINFAVTSSWHCISMFVQHCEILRK